MPKLTVVQNPNGNPCIVSATQYAMLLFVQEHPGAMYTEVSDHVGFDVPSVTTYASRLEKAGLIERTIVRIDRRNRVQLTIPEGVLLDFDVIRV